MCLKNNMKAADNSEGDAHVTSESEADGAKEEQSQDSVGHDTRYTNTALNITIKQA